MAASEAEEWNEAKMMQNTVMENGVDDKKKKKKGSSEDLLSNWGLPGYLTKEECDAYMRFREQVRSRGGEFKNTVYCFGEEEGEHWALCRWMRARKFVYDDVIKMVEEATEVRQNARKFDFYPDPVDALGCDLSIYFAQYPQLYTGFAKNGAPLFISKAGILNVDGVECITTLEGILKFHWYVMIHDFGNKLRAQKEHDPNFKRFECVIVLDLNGLTTSQLTSKALAIIKEQSAIDSVCFPETMSRMCIINAPRFFSATWRLIKGWLDPRTASKIDVISSKSAGEKRLLELVDEDQLPCDYGGNGPDTNKTLMETAHGDFKRMHTEMLYVRGHGSVTFEITEGEKVEVSVWTHSPTGGKFSLTDADHKRTNPYVESVDVVHRGSSDPKENPTSVQITKEPIAGPAQIKAKANSNGSRFSTTNFLVVFTVR